MRVLYDATILGSGHVMPKARTGVFRVVENVAKELLIKKDISLEFTSELDVTSIANCLDYLQGNNVFSGVNFRIPPALQRSYFLYKQKVRLSGKNKKSSHLEGYLDRFLINIFKVASKVNSLTSNNTNIYNELIKKSDIYHSPFLPIPKKLYNLEGKRIFLTIHDLIAIFHPQYVEKNLVELVNSIISSVTFETWILCNSYSTRNDVLNFFGSKVDSNKVFVTQLAASKLFYPSLDKLKNSEIRKKYKISEGQYILSLCTFEPRKNIELVIKAFKKIIEQEKIPDLNLVLVGTKGWMFDKVFEEIISSGAIRNKIIVTGFVPDEDLAAIYSGALMFVYPSFYEGFGLPPLEAMNCGIPVITSNNSSLPEVVGDAGLLVDPTDLDDLCEKILLLCKNSDIREKIALKSIEQSKLFSWEKCGDETLNAYKVSTSM